MIRYAVIAVLSTAVAILWLMDRTNLAAYRRYRRLYLDLAIRFADPTRRR